MFQKCIITLSSFLAAFGSVDAQNKEEDSIAKITEALSKIEAAKPKQQRKLLIFSVTRGYRHASIVTGQIALKLMGEKKGSI